MSQIHDFLSSPFQIRSVADNLSLKLTESLDRRSSGPAIPKCQNIWTQDYDGIVCSQKRFDLMTLILICQGTDYFQEFSRYVLAEIGMQQESKLCNPALAAASRLDYLSSLLLLSFSYQLQPRKLFGIVLDPARLDRIMKTFRFQFQPIHRPKRLIRHRGYRDHGTLRLDSEWTEDSDYSFTEEQLKREHQVALYDATVRLLITEVGNWVYREWI
jgi:hypothetical protein